MALSETFIVESRDDGFTGTGSRDHKVFVMVVHLALHAQSFQDVVLIVLGIDQFECSVVDRLLLILVKRLLQPLVIDIRSVDHEVIAVPVTIEVVDDLPHDVGCLHLRHLEVPFHTALQSHPTHVGTADIGGMETCVAHEDIRLGMQPVVVAVVRDLHLRVLQFGQSLHRFKVSGAHICGGDDAQASSPVGGPFQLVYELVEPGLLNEGSPTDRSRRL